MNVKEAEQFIETKEQTKKKQLTREEIIRSMSFYFSLTLAVLVLQLILPNILTNLTKGPVNLGVINGNEVSIDGSGLQKIEEIATNASSICIFILLISTSVRAAYYGYLLAKDSALVEVPISNKDNKGKLETVKIETRKKAVTGIRYKCEYCGREFLLNKYFTGFVPNCKSCGAVLEKKENINIEK